MQKLFGTDGIRGTFSKNLTPQLAFDVGRAIGIYTKLININGKIIVGKDPRTSSDLIQLSLVSGIIGQGVDVHCVGVVSTPCVAFLTKSKNYDFGIMITASHNSPEYNGIKIFNSSGLKIEKRIEESIENTVAELDIYGYVTYDKIGRVENRLSLADNYVRYLKKLIQPMQQRICFDCANGATSKIVQKLFKNEQFFLINTSSNGLDINIDCGATSPQSVKDFVKKNNCDIGISFDGDGDRILVVDKIGKEYDGDSLLYIFANYFKQRNLLKNDVVVGTLMSNFGLEKAFEKRGIALVRANVGDKYVIEEMAQRGAVLGGEQAGHIVLGDYIFTGDGVLVSIILLNILNEQKMGLADLSDGFKKYPQVIKNVMVSDKNKAMNNKQVKKVVELCESLILNTGRIVLRPSGTEPLIRIMVEGENQGLIKDIAKKIEKTLLDNL